MVGRKKQLTITELAQLIGLLSQYKDNLLYEANEGIDINEDPHDTEVRNIAIERVHDCLETAVDDLQYRLTNY